MKIQVKLIATIILLGSLLACKDDPVTPDDNFGPQIENIASNVILKTYEQLHDETSALAAALSALENNPSQPLLEDARAAWRKARQPWEQSEGFLFGPVDQQGIDPSIDSWPVNETDLDAVLSSGVSLTKTYVDGLDGTLKGFHTIEYLIFGLDGNKAIDEFTPREFEYLSACSESLTGATQQLFDSWTPTVGNFIKNLIDAGKAGESIYPSQKAALQEIVTGLIVIADEVGNGKINDPFSQQNLSLEESRFSANSKQDFADNIRSIQNVYLGKYGAQDGPGISDIISTHNTTLDAEVISAIAEAINAIESIEGTFTDAIFDAQASVQNAQTKVRDLQQILEAEVLPLITSL